MRDFVRRAAGKSQAVLSALGLVKPSPQQLAAKIFRLHLGNMGPDSVAIDCGANVGLVARDIAETGALLHCFEPDPGILPILRDRLAGNPNVRIHAAAVATEEGTATLLKSPLYDEDPVYYSERNTIRSEALTRDRDGEWIAMDASAGTEVPVVNLIAFVEDVLTRHGRLDLLKIDIEGAEVEILEALEARQLFGRIGLTVAELHEARFPDEVRKTAALRRRLSEAYPLDRLNLDWR